MSDYIKMFKDELGIDLIVDKEKYKSTCLEKFGVDNPSKSKEIIDSIRLSSEKNTLKKYSILLGDEYNIIDYHLSEFSITHLKCGNDFKITQANIYSRTANKTCICTICNPIYGLRSGLELNLESFLVEKNISFLHSDRNLLEGIELDFYFDKFDFAIEINGIYWHSDLFKDNNYHLNKTSICNSIGINLFHIWEDLLLTKDHIVKNKILYHLNKLKKIKIDKCVINEVSIENEIDFLNKNHIKGYTKSTKRIGLYYNNKLISIMSFHNNELIRFCNIIGISIDSEIVLFNYSKMNNVIYIEDKSYPDDLPLKLNMTKNKVIQPNFLYTNGSYRYLEDRFGTNIKIYDCGSIEWIT
jgi:hypothetical protein